MTTAAPKPEYPRPDHDRSDRWLSLNGEWAFECIDGPTTITVPFAWETAASGVRRTWLESATYRRTVTAPSTWAGHRIVLCFGAVHHHARVLIDGRLVGEHTGGYESFEFDASGHLTAGEAAELVVEVSSPADKRSIVHGKQRSIPRDDYDGVSFTPTSGIWQNVWLEARGRTYVDAIAVCGESLTGFEISGSLAGDEPAGTVVTVQVSGGVAERLEVISAADGTFAGRVDLAAPMLWSPDKPHLYALMVTTGGRGDVAPDKVTVTAGLRVVEVHGEQLFVNGDRLYIKGILDQGYWPETGLTAPDDAALVRDLELARDMGYNLVRKHIKLEEPRWLHYADQMGILVWAEPPAPSRFSDEAARAFESQLAPMVRRDGNHPSIIIWGLYNEEWGLDWDIPGSPERAGAAVQAYDLMRSLDDTRPIVENSGWSHVKTDLVDWHYYDEDPATWATNVAELARGEREDFPVRLGPDFVVDKSFYGSADFPRTGVPILNSEYGAGFTSLERAWHLRWQTQEIRRHDRFAGYVYTELADVEHEMAGLVDADRRPKDLGGIRPADVNAETAIVINLVPAAAGADIRLPVEPLTVRAHVSHHGGSPVSGRLCAAWAASGTPSGASVTDAVATSDGFKADPFALSEEVELTVPAPTGVEAARLHLWFVDDAGEVRARAFLDAALVEEPNRRGARQI